MLRVGRTFVMGIVAAALAASLAACGAGPQGGSEREVATQSGLPSVPPTVAKAGRDIVVGEEQTAFAVLGENLLEAKLFFRANGVEKEIPHDDRTSTAIVVMDLAILDLVPAGTYDVVVRNAHGEAVLDGAFTRAE